MVARGSDHLVSIASTAGKAGLVGGSTYCASKSAVIGFSEAIDQELAPHGVAVSIVMPGIVRTELASGIPDLPGLKAVTPRRWPRRSPTRSRARGSRCSCRARPARC